jgi:hypothetical protein
MEQLVKPSLLGVRGVTKVSHRARLLQSELERAKTQQETNETSPGAGVQLVQLTATLGAGG